MSLTTFYEAIHHFTERIKGSLDLEEDENNYIYHRKNIISWIQDETIKLRDEKDKEKKSQHIFTNILALTGINQPNRKLIHAEGALEKIKNIMKKPAISFDVNEIDELQLPSEVNQSLKKLNKAKIPDYYAVVSGPLLKSLYLRTRQDFDNCLKKVCINNLKFINLGSDFNNVIKYQRILVEQLFNRLFNRENELSMIFKIQVEKQNFERNIEIFCYVEDLVQKSNRVFKEANELRTEEKTQNLCFTHHNQQFCVEEMSIFNSFLTQMLMVPLQTIVSDYVVEISKQSAKLLKMHQSFSVNDLTIYFREHPSLRNPLFYFDRFIKGHQYSTNQITKTLVIRQIYSNFYEILNILREFIKNDFSFRSPSGKMNSLAFNQSTFKVIWKIFHQLIVLPNWIQEIISPIKQTITLYEIHSKIFPIFNDILKIQKQNYDSYQKSLLNLPIENYLTLNVSKINIEKYKDMFISINSIEYVNYQKVNIYENIFAKTLKNYNLKTVNIYEAIYFLNFFAKSNTYISNISYIHPSWKDKKLWKEIISVRNKDYDLLPYLSINLDILAFHFGYDSIKHSNSPFSSIKNDRQDEELFQRIEILIILLKTKFQKSCDEYLSFLIEKSFKHKKYKVVEYLIKKGVHIHNYDDIFTSSTFSTRDSIYQRYEEKSKLKDLMKIRQPEMFRRYQWEEFINTKLKEKVQYENLAVLQTIKRGNFYVNKDIYSHLTSSNNMNNTISRKDYMFSANRLIAKVDIFGSQAYIEITQYPLLRYFYSLFLNKIGKNSLTLNFCGFFSQKGNLTHLIEFIPQCFNFEKGLSTYTQNQLKNYTNQDDISQAIIISMILMPTNILLKNIIISPMIYEGNFKDDRKSLFIVDFHDIYQKNGFQSNGGNTVLKVRNSLFIFDEMRYVFSEKLMKKYSNLNILEIVNEVFKESSSFISEVNSVKPKIIDLPEDQRQLYTLIFQNGFCEALVQRMFKIKSAFQKCLKNKSHIDPLELLQILNPPLSYYYQQIIQSSDKLVERQKIMLDDSFKKSLIINEKLIHFLPNSYYVEQVRDSFPNHYRRFVFQGPTENLEHLYQNILKFNVYTEKITDLKEYTHQVIEYFIRNIDLSTYLKEQRQALIFKIQEYSKEYLNNEKNCLPLSIIRINNIDSIKEKTLRFSDERLKQLIFEQVKSTESEFNSLLKKYQNMRNLILKNVSGLQRIGQSLISISDTLYLKNLKYLSIIGCNEIVNIDLKCDELQHVTLRKNKSLSEIYIYSKRFKNMDCSQCTKLRLQNIGIYILKRINVLICHNSCDGDVKKLEDKSYSIFLTRILRYLFNRFEESNTYKFQLIMTLIKLDLIDEKLFGFKGSQSYSKSLVSIVSKLGKDILFLVQSQLFDLFLRNTLIDMLNIDQILKIEVSSLKIIEHYLGKLIKMKEENKRPFKKEFSVLVFKEFTKIPLYYNQHVSFIKYLVNYIDVDKTFKFNVSLSPEIAISDYIELINILNKKENLQKLQITFENSYINNDFIQFLFSLDHDKNKIGRLQFLNCQICVEDSIGSQPFVKYITLKNCTIRNINFLECFSNLQVLEINSCSFAQKLFEVYEVIGKLKNLANLSLIKLKENKLVDDLYLSELFQALHCLTKLQQLDFSENDLNQQELTYFSGQIYKIKIYQLNLYNFYNENLNNYIDSFLYHEHLKIIFIQFKVKNINLIESFINSLANNKSVLRVNIKTDHQIQSQLFEKMNKNNVIQNFNSNQPIPNWLKNHVNNNSKGKSAIYQYEAFEPSIGSVGKDEDFFRIGLSLDGGGVRGLVLATELDYLSRKVGKPLHKIFDCVGGTSIGGILALASTGSHDGYNPVCSTADLMDIFELYGNRIFKKSQFGNITNIFQTKYDVKSFENLLNGYFKQSKLSDVLPQTNVVITTVNRLTNQDIIFRSLNAIFDRNLDFYMRDVARATSAAPTYFPSAQIKNINANQRYSLIDGGVGLNNPSKLVIDDIIKITQNEAQKKNYFLLSLGTGRLINEAIPSNAGIKDLAPIIDSFTESANYFIEKDLSQNYKGHFLRVSPLINLHRKDGELDNTSPQIIKVYRDAGLEAAQEAFTNTIAFGKYKNQSLVEWLQENTDRKCEA